MHYWLFKSEPAAYSIDDLKRDGTTMWEGVRNYQARNLLRDRVAYGDKVFFYHSGTGKETGIVGCAQIVSKEAYPDPTQFDAKSKYYDPRAKEENPPWVVVDVKYKTHFKQPIFLTELKNNSFFNDMMVTQRGARLSIQPVEEKHAHKLLMLTKP